MDFQIKRPEEVSQLEKPSPRSRKFGKRRRSHTLACYVPPGEGQASRRVTGVHLDPDGIDMEASLYHFATGLLEAIQQGRGQTRSLVGPLRASDRLLAKYCQILIKSALGKPTEFLEPPLSPAIVPYLLGGITWAATEQLCYRALEVMEFMPEPLDKPCLSKAMSNIGFGAHIHHDHTDHLIRYTAENTVELVEVEKRHAHLSHRQDFLLNLPRDKGFALQLIQHGAYGDGLRRQLASWKPELIAEVETLLDPKGGEMSELAARGRVGVTIPDLTFQRAVRRVFEQDWDQLDLVCGDEGTVLLDAEVLLARRMICKLSYNDKMTAEVLVGMSLLTGVSIVNWVRFAINDRDRRGETFITADEVARAIEMVEIQYGYDCDAELNNALMQLRFDPANLPGKQKWARRLQSPVNPLWSTNGMYYRVGVNHDGLPLFKPKPFVAPKPEAKPATASKMQTEGS